MSPLIRMRAPAGIAVASLLLVVPVSRSFADPCGEPRASAHPGLQVQVDPKTGTYSLPAPGTLEETPGRAASAATTGIVVTPGTSPAGGYKVTFPDGADSPERTK